MDCYAESDLNPRTCRFTKKCKDGYERNENFVCRKSVKKLKKQNSIKMMYNMLGNSSRSPLESLDKMKQSIHSDASNDSAKRVFPLDSKDIRESDKHYIVFKGGTGIMLSDSLYKDGKMIQLSKSLSNTYSQPPVGWILSEKYDGLRGIWTGKELVARPSKKDGHMIGKVFNYVPQWFINLLPKGISLDGELWMGRGRFQEISGLSNYKINKKVTQKHLDEIWKEVKFMVFDLPHLNKPYSERYKELNDIVNSINAAQGSESPIQLSTNIVVNNLEHLSELYSQFTLNGAEGIILRHPESMYEIKRSKLLLKMKLSDDAEAIVIDYIPGTGKYKDLLGSLKCDLNGKTFNIGTGFSDIMRTEYNDPQSKHYIPIGATINFGYMELTKDGIPRHPVYRGIRTDI